MMPQIKYSKIIFATSPMVWKYLTNHDLMKQWMGEPEMGLEIITDWTVGNPILIRGYHNVKFENQGKVLEFVPEKILKYDYLSSISRLPDKPENYTIVEFRLEPVNHHTSLTMTLSNFPNESIFKHVDFYWKTTIRILKKVIEG